MTATVPPDVHLAHPRRDLIPLALLSLGVLLYHLLTAILSGYGYFIDELYYVACAKRLAFGYIDHPPLSILLLALNRSLLGDSLPAIRFLPALALAGTVFTTGIITRRLGGSRGAIILAALAVIAAPVYQVMGSFFSMNAFEILLHTLILYTVVVMVQESRPRLWLVIGVLLGLGLEMKHTMVIYAVAMAGGMLATSARRFLWTKWFVFGMLISFFLLLPNLIWQGVHGFPSLEFYRNAMVNKNIATGPVGILLDQMKFMNPLALPLLLSGVGFLFFASRPKSFRFLGWTYLLLLCIMVVSQSSRPDRIGAFYPALIAAGAVAITAIRTASLKRLATGGMAFLLLAGTALALPLFTPLLSPRTTADYVAATGISLSVESGKMREQLPQWLGDRLGWRELAERVGEVYHSLSSEEQKNAVIISTNYAGSGACELYSKEFGLPPVYATHNSYYQWGPPSDSVRTYLGVMVNLRGLEGRFDSVAVGGVQECELCSRSQQRIPIFVARGPRFSMAKEWPGFKIYN